MWRQRFLLHGLLLFFPSPVLYFLQQCNFNLNCYYFVHFTWTISVICFCFSRHSCARPSLEWALLWSNERAGLLEIVLTMYWCFFPLPWSILQKRPGTSVCCSVTFKLGENFAFKRLKIVEIFTECWLGLRWNCYAIHNQLIKKQQLVWIYTAQLPSSRGWAWKYHRLTTGCTHYAHSLGHC